VESAYGYRFNRDNPYLLLKELEAPLFIIHDQGDLVVPYRDSEVAASKFPHICLHTTKGLGHKRVLSDNTVINEVTRHFLKIKRKRNETPKIVDKYFASAELPE
jgi:pimeloyl-ACP methyl ester carboxylesterase